MFWREIGVDNFNIFVDLRSAQSTRQRKWFVAMMGRADQVRTLLIRSGVSVD